MSTRQPKSLGKRLIVNFFLQAAAISLAAILGLWVTNWLLSNVLVEEALKRESAHYWAMLEVSPDTPMPNSLNLTGYLIPRDQDKVPPGVITDLEGYHELGGKQFNAVFLEQRGEQRLVLLFNRSGVDGLIALYGILPLACVLLLLYLALWVSYLLARRTISPTQVLANAVAKLDPKRPKSASIAATNLPKYADQEVLKLAETLAQFIDRNERFIQRETAFTRDASHELRTPITVIAMAVDMLRNTSEITQIQARHVDRIERASLDMEELTDAFLMLARERETSTEHQPVSINEIVVDIARTFQEIRGSENLIVSVRHQQQLVINSSPSAVKIVLSNLVKNAVNYTDAGAVTIVVEDHSVSVIDTGAGISEAKLPGLFDPWKAESENSRSGFGVGLSIVKRLCDQFGWTIDVSSVKDSGTTIVVKFS